MHILLCDGPYNGHWATVHVTDIRHDLTFAVKGAEYLMHRWPTGEWVGVSVANRSLLDA